MLEVINRCINRRAPGSPAFKAGWTLGPWHLGTEWEGAGWQLQRRAPNKSRPHPLFCETFTGTRSYFTLDWQMQPQVGLQFLATWCLNSFQDCPKRAQRFSPPSLFPALGPAPGDRLHLSGGLITRQGPGEWNLGLPRSPSPALARLPFSCVCPPAQGHQALVLEKEASCERPKALDLL